MSNSVLNVGTAEYLKYLTTPSSKVPNLRKLQKLSQKNNMVKNKNKNK